MNKLGARAYKPEDYKEIATWFPERTELSPVDTIDDIIITGDGGEVLAYGNLKLFAEPMIGIKPDLSQIKKAQVFKALLGIVLRACLERKIPRLYVFPDTEEYGELLKRLGFHAPTKKCLALEVEEVLR